MDDIRNGPAKAGQDTHKKTRAGEEWNTQKAPHIPPNVVISIFVGLVLNYYAMCGEQCIRVTRMEIERESEGERKRV